MRKEMENMEKDFKAASGNSETITLEQTLRHREVCDYLSEGTVTQAQLESCWESVAGGQNEITFDVSPIGSLGFCKRSL